MLPLLWWVLKRCEISLDLYDFRLERAEFAPFKLDEGTSGLWLRAGKVSNYGIQHWSMLEIDRQGHFVRIRIRNSEPELGKTLIADVGLRSTALSEYDGSRQVLYTLNDFEFC